MSTWQLQHSIFTIASRRDAWTYWSDLRNHREPGVQRIELDGPFETGTTGRTVALTYTQPWTLTDVVEAERFEITGETPDGTGTLSFAWTFEDEDGGTRMTQTIRATGPDVEAHAETFRMMEVHAPEAMERLAAELDRRTRERRDRP